MTILKGGALLFACMLALFSFIGIVEFYRMSLPERSFEVWLAALSGSSLIFAPFAADNRLILTGIGLLFILFALLFLFCIREIADAAREVAYAILAFIYIPFMLMHLVMLRQTELGVQWLMVMMLIVMTNDSAAYYIGSALGRNRLYPLVSPKKSIEGALGGLVGSVCGVLLAKFTFFQQLTLIDALVTAIIIGMIGQAGDLFESMLKRSFGVKDSGTIFPGHGGVLDRLDCVLFAAPAMYYYVIFFF